MGANLSRLAFLFGECLFPSLLDACFFFWATEKLPGGDYFEASSIGPPCREGRIQ
jgi:hypothetical protein